MWCTITINTVILGGEGKNLFTSLGGDYSGEAIIRVGATIRVNTVFKID